MKKMLEKIILKTAEMAVDSASFLGVYQPKEPECLREIIRNEENKKVKLKEEI